MRKNKPSVKKLTFKKKSLPAKKQKETKYLRLGGGWSQEWGVIFTVDSDYLEELRNVTQKANGRLTFLVKENANKQNNKHPDYILYVKKPEYETYQKEKQS